MLFSGILGMNQTETVQIRGTKERILKRDGGHPQLKLNP